jgi:Meckel syndrome type 1 protein
MQTREMKTGAIFSGAMHLMFLALALFGAGLFADRDPAPLAVTQVELVDGANFDAALSTAPVVPNEGPAELAPEASNDVEPVELAGPDATIEVPDAPLLAATDTVPPKRPDFSDLQLPPPPTVVPTEAPRPSIALIPSPDSMPKQAEQPESPPATEPLQALAAAPVQDTAPRPAPPPEPEPVAAEKPEPKPEEPKQKPEPEAVAEAQPEAPIAAAPQEARLPVARPAEVAAAARASGPTEAVPVAQKPADEPKPAKPAGGSKSVFANAVTVGEKDALQLGIKRYFVYNGNRSDRTLQVTIGIRMSQDARIIGQPELIRASGGDAATQDVLFAAGRRALYKAQNAGEFEKLPPAKYDGWKLIHVTFTPEEIGFSS